MLGSKKGGDYCWSVFSGESYRPQREDSEEPAEARKPPQRAAQAPGGSKPPPKPV